MEYKTIKRKIHARDALQGMLNVGISKEIAVEILRDIPTATSDNVSEEMTFTNYQALASRTINYGLSPEQIERHALFEIASEAGEILGIYQKELQGHSINRDSLEKEIGDVLWGLAELCTSLGIDLGDVAQKNIDKLKARYPDGFDAERSIHRQEGDQ